MAEFKLFFPHLEEEEGFYTVDDGGETWIGISRNSYPEWPGFKIIDSYKTNGSFPSYAYANKVLKQDQQLMDLVITFYHDTEWHTIDGDQIINDSIADFIADWGVNAGFTVPIKHLQQILAVQQDGKFGPQTLASLNNQISENGQTLFNQLKQARIDFYNAVVKAHPDDEKYLETWMERTNSFSYKP